MWYKEKDFEIFQNQVMLRHSYDKVEGERGVGGGELGFWREKGLRGKG